jgi:surfactin synthase thioesterase subunit
MTGRQRVSLICFPHSGGGMARYRGWRSNLPSNVELVLPELPGREGRLFDPPFPDIAAVSRHAIRTLARKITRSERIAIAGISFGALVAFDMATRLEAAGTRVDAVFAASQRAPSTPIPGLNWHTMDDAELLTELVAIGGLSPELERREEFLELFLPVIRAELHASGCYVRSDTCDPLRCPIFVYHGVDDAAIPSWSTYAWLHDADHVEFRNIESTHFLTGPDGADLWFGALLKDLASCTSEVARGSIEPFRVTMSDSV